MTPKKYFLCHLVCAFLLGLNLLGQFILQRQGLDNQRTNIYSPTSTDANDYSSRAERCLGEGGFRDAFAEGTRMPGYPLFLSAFYSISDQPLLFARVIQMLLSATVVILVYLTGLIILRSPPASLFMTSIVAAWIPLYYFSAILIAESCSIFVMGLLILVLARFEVARSVALFYVIAILLAVLIYLKPNHLLLYLPVVVYLIVVKGEGRWMHLFLASMLLGLLILPWTIFVSSVNQVFVPLTTTSGLNLYLGTGVPQEEDQGTIMGRVASRLELRDESIVASLQEEMKTIDNRAQESVLLSSAARRIWATRPGAVSAYSLAKALHGFGFSFRGKKDLLLVLSFIAGIVASIILWIKKAYRPWCLFFWGVLLIAIIQMFFFLPNQRFKTVLFDQACLMMIALAFLQLIGISRPVSPNADESGKTETEGAPQIVA